MENCIPSLFADPATALCAEVLQGKNDDLKTGKFTITEAKTPSKGDAYSGTLELAPMQRVDGGITPTYGLRWTLGSIVMNGVGIEVEVFDSKTSTRKRYLVTAVGNGEVMVGRHFGNSTSDIHLEYAASGKSIAGDESTSGYIMLMKQE